MSSLIPLSCAEITDQEIDAAVDALRCEQHVLGLWTAKFEKSVAQHVGSNFGVATNSAYSAMFIALESLGIGKGDEVITSAFTNPYSAACTLQLGASPIFADCDPRSLNMDSKDVAKKLTEKTKAIIACHTYGNPAGIEALAKIAQEQEISLIEDASQAICSKLNGRKVGTFGRFAIFGFHSTAQLTSIDGGVIVTDDDGLATQCAILRSHGLISDPMIAPDKLQRVRTEDLMPSLGHGFRISEVHAAVGAIQMSRIDEIMRRRSEVAQWYTQRLGGLAEIMCPTIDQNVDMSGDGYVIRLSDRFTRQDRDELIRGLHRHEIGAADYFQSVPSLPPIQSKCQDVHSCPVAESISHRTIALPFYTLMTRREVDIVCQTLELMIARATLIDT
ncbi:MAG: DegT/DnrJ/EryC1/StrS family aminotransferase [Planctomycetota bacterium]|nr:DegT/DnrJ/EryC1/StrS family aminotransferase [Planctomycetota bacterium]